MQSSCFPVSTHHSLPAEPVNQQEASGLRGQLCSFPQIKRACLCPPAPVWFASTLFPVQSVWRLKQSPNSLSHTQPRPERPQRVSCNNKTYRSTFISKYSGPFGGTGATLITPFPLFVLTFSAPFMTLFPVFTACRWLSLEALLLETRTVSLCLSGQDFLSRGRCTLAATWPFSSQPLLFCRRSEANGLSEAQVPSVWILSLPSGYEACRLILKSAPSVWISL